MTDFASVLEDKQDFMDQVDAAQESGADLSSVSVLNVSPTTSSGTTSSGVYKVGAGLWDKTNVAKAATSEGLYSGRKKAMELAGVSFYDKPAYEAWDAKTRALMGVKKGDKFSSGQWMETFGGMTPNQINEAAGNVEYYLSDNLSPSLDNELLAKRNLSGWAKNILPSGNQNIADQVMEKLRAAGLTKEVESALTINGLPSIVQDKMKTGAGATYQRVGDIINLGQDWTVSDVVHELGHRAIVKSGGLENIQMPNVQALFEVGGNKFDNYQVEDVDGNLVRVGPHYGAQGEMVTSRAGTAQNLVDSMQYGKTSFPGSVAGFGGFEEAYGIFNPEEGRVVSDYWNAVTRAPSKNQVANSLSGPAAKGGWSANTPQKIGWYGATPTPMKVGSASGAAVANPSYSVPGTGDWKSGYENFMALQNEMPSDYYGAAYTPIDTVGFYAGAPVTNEMTYEQAQKSAAVYDMAWANFKEDFKEGTFGPASKTQMPGGGLWNSPMQGAHALVQEFMIRNKDMLKRAEGNYNVREAMYNKFVAENVASPTSKISIMERLGLANEFWDKLNYMTEQGE